MNYNKSHCFRNLFGYVRVFKKNNKKGLSFDRIPTSDISSDGTWGKKSFPTNTHMNTKSSINRSRSTFTSGSGMRNSCAR